MSPREATLRLGGVWRDGRGLAPCPVAAHGKRRGDLNWSLSLAGGATVELVVHCFAGCAPEDVLAAVSAIGDGRMAKPIPDWFEHADRVHIPSHAVASLWSRAMPITGTLAMTYLTSRRIGIDSDALRYVANAWHAPTQQSLPALLAALRDQQDNLVAVQRTYLSLSGGKAIVEPPRMTLGAMGSSSVRLTPGATSLGLAEGVETALSASRLFGIPCWAACGARLHRATLPDAIRHVTLFADNDGPGLRTATLAAKRFRKEERTVEILAPQCQNTDWNDVLLSSQG